jgi:hypothetical protein
MWTLNHQLESLYKGTFEPRDRGTQGGDDEYRDWMYAATGQGMPSVTSKHQKLKERGRFLSLSL